MNSWERSKLHGIIAILMACCLTAAAFLVIAWKQVNTLSEGKAKAEENLQLSREEAAMAWQRVEQLEQELEAINRRHGDVR